MAWENLFGDYDSSNYGGTGGAMNTGGGGAAIPPKSKPFSWGGLIGGALGTLGGGLLGPLGYQLGDKMLGGLFDTQGDQSRYVQQGGQAAYDTAIKNQAALNQAGFINPAGDKAYQASRAAKDALGSQTIDANTAMGIADMSGLRKQTLGMTRLQTLLAQNEAQRQGNTARTGFVGALKSAGASPGAMAAGGGLFAKSMNEGLLGNLNKAGDRQQQAVQTAAGMTGAIGDMYQKGLASNFQRNVAPRLVTYKTDLGIAQGMTSGFSNIAGQKEVGMNVAAPLQEWMGKQSEWMSLGNAPNYMGYST